ncbi:ABC transporter ATP-binding protein/permease [Velocimicrobium porci]|uniref:ABC transporter ATP-binding protein/permease n=1 Tax=Velocimicrobium porci TaxID=2606634 RepID=A0A6L5XXH7_9FIRM|nr:ABC transporter ATP-binding protein/permease [Velocimicrobium porci]MSS62693.1 ABC transporter ATP-binding protein/permease [Velocimicrobium porci]
MFHKRLLGTLKETRGYTAGMVVCQWISLLANIVFLYRTAGIIGSMYKKTITSEELYSYVLLVMVILCIRGICTHISGQLSNLSSLMVKEKIRTLIFNKMIRIGTRYSENKSTSEIVQISTEGVEQLEIYFGNYIPQFFYSILAPLTLFFVVGTMSIKVAGILLLCVPFIPISIVAVQKFAKKLLKKYWGTYTELGDSFLESLQGLTTLKIYNADERYAKKMDKEAERFRKVTMRVLIMQLNSISIMDLIAYGGSAIGIILSLKLFQQNLLSIEHCFFIIMVSAEFFLPLRLLGSFFHIAMNGNAAADRIFAFLDEEEAKNGRVEADALTGKDILIQNVDFAYPFSKEKEEQKREKKQILKKVSMKIPENNFIAIVGESGCGKSTVASLLTGEYSADKGKVTLGGIPITELSMQTKNKLITRVNHINYLFQGSVRENLKMGNQEASDEQMEEILKQVQLYSFIKKHGGLDMLLKENGANLSGGQRQRLSLAIALLHDSDIYIFDEATSNIDVESENLIMEIIIGLAKKKTVILITHRLFNAKSADKIYVMEKGKIVQTGIENELIKEEGIYKKLYEQQSELEDYRVIRKNQVIDQNGGSVYE